jgi:hypothetical protein
MGSTAKRIEKRKAAQAARKQRLATSQTDANARHARQQSADIAPAVFGFDPWLDSDHDYEAFGVPKWKTDDTDCWPAGFRGQLGVDGYGKDKDELSAWRERQFKRSPACKRYSLD